MRPVRRDTSPIEGEFDPYDKAQPYLISRLGSYCSYCERRVVTQLAVEHIQPKGLSKYRHLIGSWSNYLLGCVNCNSTKKDKDVLLAQTLLPDRDNTFAAFEYRADGTVVPSSACLTAGIKAIAERTLEMVGLDKRASVIADENGRQVAIDRVLQRMEVWAIAEEAKLDIEATPNNEALRRGAIRTAQGYGFFSVWMTVFHNDLDMRNRLIDAFDGTRASGCFDPVSTTPVIPAPNPDGLPSGGKL